MKTSIEKAMEITAKFEGTKGYSSVAGNFDGQGLSFGLFQWNAGQKTLQPIFRQCIKHMPATTKAIMGDGYETFVNALKTDDGFFKWTLSLNDARKKIKDPWYKRFYTLGLNEGCQKFQREAAIGYAKTAKRITDRYGFKTERAYALAFDIAIQNGSVTEDAAEAFEQLKKGAPGATEKELLVLLGTAVASTSRRTVVDHKNGKPWTIQDDVRTRKHTIAKGIGEVHGKKYDLSKDPGLSDGPANYGDFKF